ncbi:MAG: Rieske (2Fe-2S) protein [Candidatus Omnitrophota bacterium]
MRWIKVASIEEIPEGTGRMCEVDGVRIALFRRGQEVFAIEGVCPHAGAPLGEGGFDGEKVTCPWHGWEFNVRSGQCVYGEEGLIPTYLVKLEGKDVWIGWPSRA